MDHRAVPEARGDRPFVDGSDLKGQRATAPTARYHTVVRGDHGLDPGARVELEMNAIVRREEGRVCAAEAGLDGPALAVRATRVPDPEFRIRHHGVQADLHGLVGDAGVR